MSEQHKMVNYDIINQKTKDKLCFIMNYCYCYLSMFSRTSNGLVFSYLTRDDENKNKNERHIC